MVVQKAVKSYPMVKWFLLLSAVLVVVGVVMSKIITDPDNGDIMTLVYFIVAAVLLPFLALAFPRRQVLTMELPTDTLANRPKAELEAILTGLDEAKAKGEMDADRHSKARAKVTAAMKGKK